MRALLLKNCLIESFKQQCHTLLFWPNVGDLRKVLLRVAFEIFSFIECTEYACTENSWCVSPGAARIYRCLRRCTVHNACSSAMLCGAQDKCCVYCRYVCIRQYGGICSVLRFTFWRCLLCFICHHFVVIICHRFTSMHCVFSTRLAQTRWTLRIRELAWLCATIKTMSEREISVRIPASRLRLWRTTTHWGVPSCVVWQLV